MYIYIVGIRIMLLTSNLPSQLHDDNFLGVNNNNI